MNQTSSDPDDKLIVLYSVKSEKFSGAELLAVDGPASARSIGDGLAIAVVLGVVLRVVSGVTTGVEQGYGGDHSSAQSRSPWRWLTTDVFARLCTCKTATAPTTCFACNFCLFCFFCFFFHFKFDDLFLIQHFYRQL